MLRKIVFGVILLLVLTCVGMPGSAANTAVAGKNTASAQKSSLTEISKVRWALHNDAVSGVNSLRMVIDVSGQVTAAGSLINQPSPRLVVNIKGAVPGKIDTGIRLDGKIAVNANFSKRDKDTQILIDLPTAIGDKDYNVFILPGDSASGKSFRVVIDILKPVVPISLNFKPGLKGKLIALDPGHGGSDCGAVGPNQVYEKTVALSVAQKIKSLLENAGAKVVMTRNDDRDVYAPNASATDELNARVAVGNSARADVFLSIHANSFSDRSVGGTGTYYYSKTRYDELFAQNIQNALVEAVNLNDRGVRTANFVVVKKALMSAALVELAFISNYTEEKMLSTPETQQQMAQGIVQGIENFLNQAAKQGGGGS